MPGFALGAPFSPTIPWRPEAPGYSVAAVTYADFETVILRLVPSTTAEVQVDVDAATVVLRLVPSAVEIKTTVDAATVIIYLVVTGHDCYFPLQPSFVVSGERKWFVANQPPRRYQVSGLRKWAAVSGETEAPVC